MIKKRIIAFDLEPQPLHSISLRGSQRSKVISPDDPQERYYVDPSRPPRPVAHENIADYMQVAAPRKSNKRIQTIKENQPEHVKQNILKNQVEALLNGQRSHTLRPLRNKLIQIALALAENARIWHRPTVDQKRAEAELSVSEIKNDALVYETVVSPTGYTYRRPRKAADDDSIQESAAPAATAATAAAPAASAASHAVDSATTVHAVHAAHAANTGKTADAHSFYDDEYDNGFDVPSTSGTYDTAATDSAYAAMMQNAVEASVRAYESTSTVSGSYTDVEHSFSSISGAEASEAIAQSATATSTAPTTVVAGEASAALAPAPAKRRGRPRKVKPEDTAAIAAATNAAPAMAADTANATAVSASNEFVAPNATQTLENLANHAPVRKRGRPRKVKPEDLAAISTATDTAATTSAPAAASVHTDITPASGKIYPPAPEAETSLESLATHTLTRKRGRPRKVKPEDVPAFVDTTAAASTTVEAAASAVSVGEVAASAFAGYADAVAPAPAKKRGRPRKIRPDEAAIAAEVNTTSVAPSTAVATAVADTTANAVEVSAVSVGDTAVSAFTSPDEAVAFAPAKKRGRPRKIQPTLVSEVESVEFSDTAYAVSDEDQLITTASEPVTHFPDSALDITTAELDADTSDISTGVEPEEPALSAAEQAEPASPASVMSALSRSVTTSLFGDEEESSRSISVKSALKRSVTASLFDDEDEQARPVSVKSALKRSVTASLFDDEEESANAVTTEQPATSSFSTSLFDEAEPAHTDSAEMGTLGADLAEVKTVGDNSAEVEPTGKDSDSDSLSAGHEETQPLPTASVNSAPSYKRSRTRSSRAKSSSKSTTRQPSIYDDPYLKDLEYVAQLGRARQTAQQAVQQISNASANNGSIARQNYIPQVQRVVTRVKATTQPHQNAPEKLQQGKENKLQTNLEPWQRIQLQYAKSVAANLGLPEPNTFEEARKLLSDISTKKSSS